MSPVMGIFCETMSPSPLEGRLTVRPIAQAEPAFEVARAWGLQTWGEAGDPLALGLYALVGALHNDVPVGCAALAHDDLPERSDLTPWLANVFVLPGYRQHGVATLLVAAVVAEARARGFSEIWLYHDQPHTLYARMGWRPVEHITRQGGEATVMKRLLTDA